MILGCGLSASLTCMSKVFAMTMCMLLCLVAGIATVIYNSSKTFSDWVYVTTYVTIGWFATIPSLGIFDDSLYAQTGVIPYILASGALYCTGIIFYTKDSKKWNHTIWHLFVMAGACAHITAHIYSISR
jgi:channel protein (hemolysin III family)